MPGKYPSTAAQLRRRWPTWESDGFEDCLNQVELKTSGSKWGENHLRACRVLVEKNKLPNDLSKSFRKVQESNFPELFEALQSIETQDLWLKPRSELRKKGGIFGSFFIHLADLIEVKDGPLQYSNPERDPRHATRRHDPGFLTGEGLSSPLRSSQPLIASSPPSEYQPHDQITTDEDVHMERTKSEVLTAQMLTEFVSVIVDLCQVDPQSRLVVTSAPSSYKVKNKYLDCECRDDGCLIWHCLIEVKPSVTNWNIDEEGDPEVNTRLLGQQICEILGAFLQSMPKEGTVAERFQSLKAPHVFLISAQQTILTLLHVEFNQAYLQFFTEPLTTDDTSYLTVFRSKSYDLASENGRSNAAKLIITLCEFLAICQMKEGEESEG